MCSDALRRYPISMKEDSMSAVREFMTTDARCVGENESLLEAARMMRDLDCGALPICGDDGKLKGMITDRDIVLKCVAAGRDPGQMMARDLASGKPYCVDADANVDDAIGMMEQHQVRRLPVISDHKLVGIISQGDIARNYSEQRVGELVEHISERHGI
jgi:CBS domain-containing protein